MSIESDNDLPLYEAEDNAAYSLEIIAEITGVSSHTILQYQEHGLIQPSGKPGVFDDESVYTLRRITHLQNICEINLSGIKLILSLMDEVERLKISLRGRT